MKKEEIHVNIKFSTKPNELGVFIKYIASENVCGYATAVRKIVNDAKKMYEKKQLKNMPLFKK